MTAEDFRAWRTARRWSRAEAAAYLGVTATSLYRYEHDQQGIPLAVAILCHLLTDEKNQQKVRDFLRGSIAN